MTTLAVATMRAPDKPARGRRKQRSMPTPPGLLTGYVLSIFRGDFLSDSFRHAGARSRAIVAQVAYACFAALGASWLLSHPGQSNYRAVGGIPLASSAVIALIAAVLSFLIAADRSDLVRACVRWGRRVAAAFDYGAIALVSISATCGIGIALYSARVEGIYDTDLLRADALAFSLIAGFSSLGTRNVVTRPVFSVLNGRPRTVAHLLAAASRVLVAVSLFASIAALATPGSTTWITVAAGLLLTSIGWELAQRASNDQALLRFLECATALQSAASRPDGDLLGSLAALENACSRKCTSRRFVIEIEVAMVVRSCLERIDTHERRRYAANTVMANLQTALAPLDDTVVRDEIGRFATALRQSVALQVPLFHGDIWTDPRARSLTSP